MYVSLIKYEIKSGSETELIQLAVEWVNKHMALFVVGTPDMVQGEMVLKS
jgi:hypothetical protein